MKRVALGIGLGLLVAAVGFSLAKEDQTTDFPPRVVTTTTYMIYPSETTWEIDPAAPLSGGDLPSTTAAPE